MYSRNIGLDIDGFLNNIEDYQLKKGLTYFKKKYIKRYYKEHGIHLNESDVCDDEIIKNVDGKGIKEVFGCSKKEEIIFWILHTFDFAKEPARPFAAEMTKKFHAQHDRIYIITSRAMTTKKNIPGAIMRHIVKKWLKENGIEYDEIIYCSEENSAEAKVEACRKYNINVFFEDTKENAIALSEVTNVICMATRNNVELYDSLYDNIYYIFNLEEAFRKEQELRSKDYWAIQKQRFPFLSLEERNKLTHEELVDYYRRLKEFYMSLPYDSKQAEQYKEQCKKTVTKWLRLIKFFFNPQTLNKDLLPKENGVILAPNHLHSFDPLLVVNSMENKSFRLLAKIEIATQKLIGKMFKKIGTVFVDPDDEVSKDVTTEQLIQAILHGENVMEFSEGHRNTTSNLLQKYKNGPTELALKTGAPIYPYAVNKHYKFFRKGLYDNVGEKIYVKPGDDFLAKRDELRDANATLLWQIMEHELKTGKVQSQQQLWELYKHLNEIYPDESERRDAITLPTPKYGVNSDKAEPQKRLRLSRLYKIINGFGPK